jgi:hypothetical protein
MTIPSDLERRLADVLQQRAEDAMNDTKTEERLDTLLSATELDRRRRKRVWAAGTLAAAAAAAAVIAWVPGLGGDEDVSGPDTAATGTAYQAERVATRFVTAYAAFDRQKAGSYLDGNVIGLDAWREQNRWYQAVGFQMMPDACRAQGTDSQGATTVNCPYDYESMGSDELGRGPFTGSRFVVTVREGKIVTGQLDIEFLDNGFSAKVWEPFAAWVKKAHPKEAAVMYADDSGTTLQSETRRANRLWRQNVREYVEEQQAENPG